MRNILQQLIQATKNQPQPTSELKAAIVAAQNRLGKPGHYPELAELAKTLRTAEPTARITFAESANPDNRYALTVETYSKGLLRQLAQIFGCPHDALPDGEETEFEAGDDWHGNGLVDLRNLADELSEIHDVFFTETYTVAELQHFIPSA